MPSPQDLADAFAGLQTDAADLVGKHTDSVTKDAAAAQAVADASGAHQAESASSQHLAVDLAAFHQLADALFSPDAVLGGLAATSATVTTPAVLPVTLPGS